ncbi:hypothetical protein [Eisenbergiella sp.]
MDKKKKTMIVIAGALLLTIIAVVFFLIVPKTQDPVESLQKSIEYADGKLQFTIPEAYKDSWYIQISGRTQTEEGGMSVHYLEENSTGKGWEKNRTYSFEVLDGYSELTMFLSIDGQDTEIDLLRYLPSSK